MNYLRKQHNEATLCLENPLCHYDALNAAGISPALRTDHSFCYPYGCMRSRQCRQNLMLRSLMLYQTAYTQQKEKKKTSRCWMCHFRRSQLFSLIWGDTRWLLIYMRRALSVKIAVGEWQNEWREMICSAGGWRRGVSRGPDTNFHKVKRRVEKWGFLCDGCSRTRARAHPCAAAWAQLCQQVIFWLRSLTTEECRGQKTYT